MCQSLELGHIRLSSNYRISFFQDNNHARVGKKILEQPQACKKCSFHTLTMASEQILQKLKLNSNHVRLTL